MKLDLLKIEKHSEMIKTKIVSENQILSSFFRSHVMDVFTSKQIEMVDFTDSEARRVEINAFVEEATHSFIKELLPPGSIQPYSKAVLANAAFFRGFWKTKFDKTEWKHFNCESSKSVEMMHVRGHFRYGSLHVHLFANSFEIVTFLCLRLEKILRILISILPFLILAKIAILIEKTV